MRNGLYRVQFATPSGAGAGVVVLNDGKMLGGDSALAYTGEYSEDGDSIRASVSTKRHTASPMPSVFGVDNVTLTIEGKTIGDEATLTGSAAGITFRAKLTPVK